MKYFKNTELANIYNVSEKTVRNWIDSAEKGRIDLQLYIEKGKSYVANTPQNTKVIEQQAQKGQKFRNKRTHKVISPTSRFYSTYSEKQIFDIISNMTIHREIPLKYSYVDNGAEWWNKYAERLIKEDTPNMLNREIQLLDLDVTIIDHLIRNHKSVNIVDLGPGNGLPIKNLISHLSRQKKLKHYIAIDISAQMLRIVEQNVKEWFGDTVSFAGYVRDFNQEPFNDIFAEDYADSDEDVPLNLVLLLSGTLCNFRSPSQALLAINNSLGVNDLFIYSVKLDTANSRRYFDLGTESKPQVADFLFKTVLDLLGIDEDLYELDLQFDEKLKMRAISLRPKVALSLEFKLSKGTRRVDLNKGDPILLWRYRHQDAIEVINQFDRSDFDLMQAAKSTDQEYLLLISKIKTGTSS